MIRFIMRLLKNKKVAAVIKPLVLLGVYVFSLIFRLDRSVRSLMVDLVKSKRLIKLIKTILFLMKFKFQSLERYSSDYHPATVQTFFGPESQLFVDSVSGFISYIERHQLKTYFQHMALLNFYCIRAGFLASSTDMDRAREIYQHLKQEAKNFKEPKGYNARARVIGKLKSKFSLDQAKQCLIEIEKILSASNTEFFLVSGTLLGAVRSGEFLSHDYDIDLGVILEKEDLARLGQIFSEHPDFTVKATPPFRLLLKYKRSMAIDIFNHVQIDDQYFHGTPDRFWINRVFKLKPIKFLGKDYLGPDDLDLYLTENYGDWRTPKKEYNAFFDTPNFLIPRNIYSSIFFSKIAYFYYLDGDEASLRKVQVYLDELILNSKAQPLSAQLFFEVPCFDRQLTPFGSHSSSVNTFG